MKEWFQKLGQLLAGKELLERTRLLQNVRRYGVRDPMQYDLDGPTRTLSPLEVRGLALGGILAYWNNDTFYQLPPLCPECRAPNAESLAQSWGITTPAEAHQCLQRLGSPGHRQELRQRLKQEPDYWYGLFRQNPFLARRAVSGIAAWDYARLANLARWCYDVGYLNWEEAWPYIDQGNHLAQREYDSWESFATGFVAGRLMWNPGLDSHAEIADVARFLVESKLSPWRTLPWAPYLPGPGQQAAGTQ